MKLTFRLPSARVAGICLFIGVASLVHAKDSTLNYLAAGKPEAASILPPPPFPDSVEQNADLDTVRRVSRTATPVEVAAALSEKKFSVFNFTPAVGAYFTEASLPKTAAFFEKVQSDAANVTEPTPRPLGSVSPWMTAFSFDRRWPESDEFLPVGSTKPES